MFSNSVCRGEAKLGSCVAVAAALLPQQLRGVTEVQQQPVAGSTTPLLLTHGSKDTEVPLSRAAATVDAAERAGMLACLRCTHMCFMCMQVVLQVLLQMLFLCATEHISAALSATPDLVFLHLWLI